MEYHRVLLLASMSLCSLCSLPPVSDAEVIYTISPRLWYFFDGLSEGTFVSPGGEQEFSFNSNPFDILMYGASLSLRSTELLPDTTFVLSVLHGNDDEPLTTRGANVTTDPNVPPPNQLLAFTDQSTNQELDRWDVELLALTRINELLSWGAGVRWEHARIDFDATFTTTFNDPVFAGQVRSVTENRDTFTGGYDLVSIRGGLAAGVPISEDGRHVFYGNMLPFVGYRFEHNKGSSPVFDNAMVIGPDATIGYAFAFNETFSIDVRYRALVFFFATGDTSLDAPKVTQGPIVGLNVTF